MKEPTALASLDPRFAGVFMRLTEFDAAPRKRYAFVVAAVLSTLVVVDVSVPVFPGGGAFLLLLLPVMIGSLTGGVKAGLTALLLGALGSILLVLWRGHPWLSETVDAARLLLYLAEGGLVVVLVSALRVAGRGRLGRAPDPVRPMIVSVDPLTAREVDILRLAASGLSIRAIGAELHLSRNTVKTHLSGVYGKLAAHNRAQAIAAGLQLGYLDIETLRTRWH
jgi:DNA-binding CsgD family transcriptional regulator